jgi:hypothetical protein
MEKPKIIEMPNFKYTPQGFAELKTTLKNGNIVRNPFAQFYSEKVEVTIIQDTEETDLNMKA